jgi:hypothetical protein
MSGQGLPNHFFTKPVDSRAPAIASNGTIGPMNIGHCTGTQKITSRNKQNIAPTILQSSDMLQ